ncbi:MAG: hypothetical protein IJD85_03870 [Oscillospiraceae bacterium]|nr:hypothetical protein [Oscillospiraceae bacterium]
MNDLTRAREVGDYGKKEELPLIRKGSFKCAYNHEMVYLLAVAGLAVVSFIAMMPIIVSANFAAEQGDISFKTSKTVFMAVIILLEVVFGTIFAFVFMGRRCEYDAGEHEFIVKGPGQKTEYFYYSDVRDITFEPIKLFGNHRGFLITITTSLRQYEYRYIFSDNKVFKDINATPFYYLGVNSGIFTTEKPTLDTDGVESMFESMVVEQITRKNYAELEKDGRSDGGSIWKK